MFRCNNARLEQCRALRLHSYSAGNSAEKSLYGAPSFFTGIAAALQFTDNDTNITIVQKTWMECRRHLTNFITNLPRISHRPYLLKFQQFKINGIIDYFRPISFVLLRRWSHYRLLFSSSIHILSIWIPFHQTWYSSGPISYYFLILGHT